MKIEKILKNRAKQAKVGCLKKPICALKTSNMAPIPSENTWIFQRNVQIRNLGFLLSMQVDTLWDVKLILLKEKLFHSLNKSLWYLVYWMFLRSNKYFEKKLTLTAKILIIYLNCLFNLPYPASFQWIFCIPLCNVPFLLSCILVHSMLKCRHIFCHLFLGYAEKRI